MKNEKDSVSPQSVSYRKEEEEEDDGQHFCFARVKGYVGCISYHNVKEEYLNWKVITTTFTPIDFY